MKLSVSTRLASVLLFSLFISTCSYAQEHIIPLGSNSVLQGFLIQEKHVNSRRTAFNDTITLPFIDDFSRPGVYPFDSLWVDSNAFINTTFSANPVTIGIATLDGLDAYGRPHDSLASADAIADYLTSRPIDLGGLQNDTSVWLSFFYQPQGLGDIPESNDSLVLQFKTNTDIWQHIWSVPGKADTAFTRVNIRITDNAYLYKGFQFRFYNIATVNGNRDHWHLDYVILNKNTVANDSIRDNAFINTPKSLLSEYTSIPYTHYKSLSNPSAAMITQLSDTVRNLNYGSTSFTYITEISNENGTPIFNSTPSNLSSTSNSLTVFNTPLAFSFPQSIPKDSTEFHVKAYFGQPGFQSNAHNDTTYYRQKFHNYYSYDDGSAEVAYGLSGNTDVMMAMRYDVKMADTLRGVQIYFNPVGVNVHNKLFQLAYWNQLSVSSNSANLIYKMINLKPANVDSINGFATYLFDTLLVVPAGPAYVGIIQNEPQTLYGIGLDRNTDSRSNMFYHVDGFWNQTGVKGSWMIRPLFGDTIITGPVVSVAEINGSNLPFRVYPNPAGTTVRLDFEKISGGDYRYFIYNVQGALLNSARVEPGSSIHLRELSKGIYLIRLVNLRNGQSATQKIILE